MSINGENFFLEDYNSVLDIRETVLAIKLIKDYFEKKLGEELNLTRVSAPLFVRPETGLNDNLSGIERPVSFDVPDIKSNVEIVHSLAKWKRFALKRYNFKLGEGLYTDMNAIRRDEVLDNTHSIYVDQWDWELILSKEDRNINFLKETVTKIYSVFKKTELYINSLYPDLKPILPEKIHFLTSQDLEDLYPNLSYEEREDAIAKDKGAVFLMQIGHKLKSGKPHGNRAPDYDDWNLNGDILFWYPPLNKAIELSSMGIRVDEKSLKSQIELAKAEDKLTMDYHKKLINGDLPLTIGGGIGQSRMCMFFLQKIHIGEVQASVWSDKILNDSENTGTIFL